MKTNMRNILNLKPGIYNSLTTHLYISGFYGTVVVNLKKNSTENMLK